MNTSDLSQNSKWTEYLYDAAVRRLYELELNEEQIEFCLADWPEGNEHLIWLIAAPREEIINWCLEC